MNIILTGLRGSGKSTIGKLIAEKLKWKFIDLDIEIEKSAKMKIKEIVETHDWKHFRQLENKMVKKISKRDKLVVATGGGTIIDPGNEKLLKKNGKIIYLYVKSEICAERILNDPNRPPLTDKKNTLEEIKHLYKERNKLYTKGANLTFKRSTDVEKDTVELINKLSF